MVKFIIVECNKFINVEYKANYNPQNIHNLKGTLKFLLKWFATNFVPVVENFTKT